MDIKREFVELALREGANRRELCRRFGISAKTGYALLARHAQEEAQAYTARSTRPVHSPTRTAAQMEQAVVALRCEHPSRGGRKIARRLSDLGHRGVPMPSTVTAILHRHGLIAAQASAAAQHWQRFEHEAPNALWQIDFKGDFDTGQARCYPLTLQRWLQGVQAQPGRLPVRPGAVAPSAAQRSRAYRRTRTDRAASARSRARWQAAYEEVRRRHGWGESLLAIGRSMALARSTVRKFA